MDGSVSDDGGFQEPDPLDDDVQYRQAVLGTGSPSLAAPAITTLVTCTCVPPGSCTVQPTLPTDGSGQIDIRIVNTVGLIIFFIAFFIDF